MIVRYMITCFGTTFETFTEIEIESLQGLTTLYGRLISRLWQPCLLTDRDEISNLYRGPSIDASYQVSVHLAEEF